MGLRSFLANPNGGQLFSAYMLLVPAIILAMAIAGNLVIKLVHGDPIEFSRDGIGLIGMLVIGIPAILKFVRSRHAR